MIVLLNFLLCATLIVHCRRVGVRQTLSRESEAVLEYMMMMMVVVAVEVGGWLYEGIECG